MLIVSDTTPINYLLLIGEIDLLPVLFQSVCIPRAVLTELQSPQAPPLVRSWAENLPDWVNVKEVTRIAAPFTAADLHLDAGEQEALTLAYNENATLIILDELRARRVAQAHGLTVAGTLGIIEQASQRGLLDLMVALQRLQDTSFYVSPSLVQTILARNSRNALQ